MAVHAMIVISPHLDDAVFSAGQIIAAHPGATVVTVFAGLPSAGLLTAYDQQAGYSSSLECVTARRREDLRAMSVLDATAVHGDFLDGQYVVPATPGVVVNWLTELMRGHDEVVVPLGIQHPDHVACSDAAIAAASPLKCSVFLYEELPYRVQQPEETAKRVAALKAAHGLTLSSLGEPADVAVKAAAAECYRSQMNPAMRRNIYVDERVWRLR